MLTIAPGREPKLPPIVAAPPLRREGRWSVGVATPTRSYAVEVGVGLLGGIGERVRAVAPAATAAVVADSSTAEPFGAAVRDSLRSAGYAAELFVVPAGEASKSWEQVGRLLDQLLSGPLTLDRGSPLLAVGGGVVGDLAGFAAAVCKRGIPLIQVPTTLLAQVDASIGGKTGVNHATGKNLIGAVHQPSLVVADVATLERLPARQWASGLAEVVKHAVIADGELMSWLERHAGLLTPSATGWPARLAELVARNCAIKAAVVSADENENGLRALLNYGHSIGHAVEAAAGYEAGIPHGFAVAIGMVAEAELAVRRGLISAELAERQSRLLERLGLPVRMPTELADWAAEPSRLLTLMRADKKNRAGRLRIALPLALGRADLFDDVGDDEVRAAIAAVAPADARKSEIGGRI